MLFPGCSTIAICNIFKNGNFIRKVIRYTSIHKKKLFNEKDDEEIEEATTVVTAIEANKKKSTTTRTK